MDQSKTRLFENYNNFLEQLKIVFTDNVDTFNYFLNESDDEKYNRCLLFVNLFDDEHFDLFLKSKIKVFSHKSPETLALSSSLFMVDGESKFYLKELLNNQPEQVKTIMWNNLYTIYLLTEVTKESYSKERVEQLSNLLVESGSDDKVRLMREKLNEVIGDNVNESTKAMLEDMISGFSNILENPSNMLQEMIGITSLLTSKYSDKINSGEIEVDKVIRLSLNKFPNMNNAMIEQIINMLCKKQTRVVNKEKVVMDENFSTANVEQGKLEDKDTEFKIRSLLPMLSSLNKLQEDGTLPQMDTIMNMMNTENMDEMMNVASNMMSQMQETGQMDNIMKVMSQMQDNGQMNNVMEMASKLMSQVQETGEMPKLDNVLNMVKDMQSTGELPTLEQSGLDMNNLASMMSQLKQSDKVQEMMSKMGVTDDLNMDELINLTKQ